MDCPGQECLKEVRFGFGKSCSEANEYKFGFGKSCSEANEYKRDRFVLLEMKQL
jgi:hypothetical protein